MSRVCGPRTESEVHPATDDCARGDRGATTVACRVVVVANGSISAFLLIHSKTERQVVFSFVRLFRLLDKEESCPKKWLGSYFAIKHQL